MKPASMTDRKPWFRIPVARLLGSTVFLLSALLFSSVPVALAESCPNEAIRKTEAEYDSYASQMPDCRAYEQVSPVDKNTTDAIGTAGFVESSSTGESVSYYSVVPFPGIPGSLGFPLYLSTRGSLAWSTQGLLPLTEITAVPLVLGLTDNDDETIVYVGREEGLLLAPGADPHTENLYAHNNLTGEYRLIATHILEATFVGATPNGSHVLFSAIMAEGEELGGVTDPNFVPYLFEWDRETGQVTLVGVVGGGAPQEGVVAGPNTSEELGGPEIAYEQNAISENGSRVFFSEPAGGKKVYMREPGANRTVEVSEGAAQWRAATPSGSKAFYTEGRNLYEYDVETETRTAITTGPAGVLGTLGVSNDGSYAYFVAEEVLVANENGEGVKAKAGEANLYEWHEGTVSFIAILDSFYDGTNWEGYTHDRAEAANHGYKASRVSADGTKVLIASAQSLTSYDNAGAREVYLYDATKPLSAINPRCVSCNLTGTSQKEGGARLSSDSINSEPATHIALLQRNLSVEGTRVFFQSAEALLPQVTNGQENVYEWEREGTGSCRNGQGDENGGCLYLISTGQSASPSYFGDASANGEDVFFFTRQSLVSQDQDDNVDAYDAREDGGLESQNMPSAGSCESETCRGGPGSGPAFGVPSSVSLSGVGNLAPPVESTVPVKPKAKPKALTRAQKLVRALKACEKRSKRERARCERQARKRYGSAAKQSDRRGN